MSDPIKGKAKAAPVKVEPPVAGNVILMTAGSKTRAPVLRGVPALPVSLHSASKPAPGEVRRIRILPDERAPRSPPPVFETVRVVILARLRVSLQRHMASLLRKGHCATQMPGERRALLETLNRMHLKKTDHWPDVVVHRSSQPHDLQTNFAVIGGMIYLGAHLSRVWEDGKEDPAFFVALNGALAALAKTRQSRFEAVPSPCQHDASGQ